MRSAFTALHASIFIFILGNALLRRLVRIGVLDEGRMKLDYVLGLKVEDFMERRLQTQVCYDIKKNRGKEYKGCLSGRSEAIFDLKNCKTVT